MLYIAEGGKNRRLSRDDLIQLTQSALEKIGSRKKVLILPPDYTRLPSRSGIITKAACDYYQSAVKDIMPTIGTHQPMTLDEISGMYVDIPRSLFRVHNWRGDLVTLGRVPADYIREISGNRLDFDLPAQVNRILLDGGHDLIISIGQVVPHEVVGMANYNKNIFIGIGGTEGIHKSHYLGAVCGMENIMGRLDTPVRRVLNYSSENFASGIPILYIQTVVASDENGKPVVRGLFIGDDAECFEKAAALSSRVNITILEKRLKRIVVYLPPESYKSTWLGNKAIYRSRMAIENGGELTVIAPGIRQFGEDPQIDRIIREFGYRGTEEIIRSVSSNPELADNLGAAAHLIHGSSEGRFTIKYAAGKMSRKEITSVGYQWCEQNEAMNLFDPVNKNTGFHNDANGSEFYLIINAGIGLWSAEGINSLQPPLRPENGNE